MRTRPLDHATWRANAHAGFKSSLVQFRKKLFSTGQVGHAAYRTAEHSAASSFMYYYLAREWIVLQIGQNLSERKFPEPLTHVTPRRCTESLWVLFSVY